MYQVKMGVLLGTELLQKIMLEIQELLQTQIFWELIRLIPLILRQFIQVEEIHILLEPGLIKMYLFKYLVVTL
jgi:hypothetical protein